MDINIHQITVKQEELSILISALKYLEYEFELNSEEEQLLKKLITFAEKE